MNFFDEALEKAKVALDVAQKKTSEIVSVGKQKYDIASLENTLSKLYSKLGKKSFMYFSKEETNNTEIKEIVSQIKEQIEKIEEANAELSRLKNKRVCPVCAKNVDENSVYCNHCGAKLIYSE